MRDTGDTETVLAGPAARPRVVPAAERPAAAAAPAMPGGWPLALAVLFGGLMLLFLAFRETVSATAETWWTTASYNHGMIVPLVVLYLAWERREALARLTPHASAWGLPLMAAASVAWTFGAAVSVIVVQQLALVGMIWALVLTVLGPRPTRRLAFPLAFLLFAVPMGDTLVPHLQDVTAQMVVALLRLSGIPVFHDGVYIQTAFGRFEVAEACAGLRFLTANVAFCTLLAWLLFRSLSRRVLFVLAGVAVAVVANGLRAYGIILLAREWGIAAAVGVDHLVYGWLFFSFVMVIMAAAGWLLRQCPAPPRPAPAGPNRAEPGGRGAGAALVALLVAVAMPVWATDDVLPRGGAGGPVTTSAAPPPLGEPEGWTRVLTSDWMPRFAGAGSVLRDSFTTQAAGVAGVTVDRVVAWFPQQAQGREVVSGEHDLTGPGWRRLTQGRQAAEVAGEPVTVRVLKLGNGRGWRLVWSWYWVDGAHTGDALTAKLLQARGLVTGGTAAGALLTVSAVFDTPDDAARADRALRAFLGASTRLSEHLAAAATGAPALARH